ncbi:PP2C family serine/threonine-protein phosphatase [Streptomyces sp. CAU 1734]|uniref:PP2C family protein-serine/threonine phosphatase n=1 Tax=Streptomyces sp. CAU 1734 TaxID=3140360 RepID=UPI0032608D77
MSSQMHQPAREPSCPGCAEPLERADRFCGACGYALAAVPAPAADHPTLAIGVPGPEETPGGRHPAAGPAAPDRTPDPQVPGQYGHPDRGHDPSAGGYGRTDGGYDTPGDAFENGFDARTRARAHASARGGGAEPGPGAPGHVPGGGGDFELPAPARTPAFGTAAPDPRPAGGPADPRAVTPPAPTSGKVCVACRSGRVDTDGYCENCGHAQPRERDHLELELGSVAAVSDRGLRHHRNEDAFALSSTALPDGSPAVVAIVCDGVSSATRPDEASQAAAIAANELLLDTLPRGTHPQQAMREAIVAAASAVTALAGQTPPSDPLESGGHQLNAPACTIVGAVAAGGLLIVGWVGDSRAYWVPDDRGAPAARLTEDDSWAAQMVAAGLMNEAEAYADQRAHAITGWLGADAYELDPHTAAFKPDRPGVVVVCTDGLWNYAEGAAELAGVIPADAAERPLHSAQILVGHALDGGGHDNVTVAVLPFAVTPQGAPAPAHDTRHRA